MDFRYYKPKCLWYFILEIMGNLCSWDQTSWTWPSSADRVSFPSSLFLYLSFYWSLSIKKSLSLNQTRLIAMWKRTTKYRNTYFIIFTLFYLQSILFGFLCLIPCWINSLNKLIQDYWKLIPSNLHWLPLNFICINKLISIQYLKKIWKAYFQKILYSPLDILMTLLS